MLIYDEPFIKVRPEESNEVLLNPGKGFATYQRFNGDPLTYDLTWINAAPTEFPPFTGNIENKDYPQTTIAYLRWFWVQIEPEKGKRRWDIIDRALECARERGQSVQLGLMPVGGRKEPGVPKWYAKIARTKETLQKGHLEPFYEDEDYLKHWGDLIRELGSRYDGHPNLETVDVSFIGPWGEGGSENGGEAYQEETNRLMDVYIESFRKTPLLALINGYEFIYGIRKGLGWRADCFGDVNMSGGWGNLSEEGPPADPDPLSWNHMYDYYPMQVVKAGAQEAWKTKPVVFETCWVPMTWYRNNFPVDWIIQQGLKYHMSVFMPKSSPVPPEWTEKFNEFIKRMGYRFVLRQMMTPAKVKRGGLFWYYLWIENIGVAPIYRRYRLAFRIRQGDVSEIIVSPTDVTKWLPGDIWLDEKRPLPPSLRPGKADVDVALIDEKSNEPKVKFAIKNIRDDGWHPMLTIEII